LVNYIIEPIRKNVLTASSAAKEVIARVDLLQATQFIANSWRRVSTKTIQNCFALEVFKHSDLEMVSKVDSETGVMLEMLIGNYEEFSSINSSLQCCNENEDCEEVVFE
jgi:hypothetical protein